MFISLPNDENIIMTSLKKHTNDLENQVFIFRDETKQQIPNSILCC